MLRLYLLRHAKSSWRDPLKSDYDRPLNARGVKSAPAIGNFMAQQGYHPQLILCSGARRTRETLGLLLPFLRGNSTIRIEENLYTASNGSALLERLHSIEKKHTSALLLGHNPAIQDLFCTIGKPTPNTAEHYRNLATKYPTAALTCFTFPAASWAQIGQSSGTLMDCALPRLLLSKPAD